MKAEIRDRGRVEMEQRERCFKVVIYLEKNERRGTYLIHPQHYCLRVADISLMSLMLYEFTEGVMKGVGKVSSHFFVFLHDYRLG